MIFKAFVIAVVLAAVLTFATYGVPPGLKALFPAATAPAPAPPAPAASTPAAQPVGAIRPSQSVSVPAAPAASPPRSAEPACKRHEDKERNHVTITC